MSYGWLRIGLIGVFMWIDLALVSSLCGGTMLGSLQDAAHMAAGLFFRAMTDTR